MTGQTCDNLWPFGKKKSCVNSKFQFQDYNLLIIGESQCLHLHCCPLHNGTSVHYMYRLVRRQLKKINVVRILQNSSFYGYICVLSQKKTVRNINVIRIPKIASINGYMIWVFVYNSTELSNILKVIWTHCPAYWTAYSKWLSSHKPHHH
jgi:hypothetical protein